MIARVLAWLRAPRCPRCHTRHNLNPFSGWCERCATYADTIHAFGPFGFGGIR